MSIAEILAAMEGTSSHDCSTDIVPIDLLSEGDWIVPDQLPASPADVGFAYNLEDCDRLNPREILDVYRSLQGCLREFFVDDVVPGELAAVPLRSTDSVSTEEPNPYMSRWIASTPVGFNIENCGRLTVVDLLEVHETMRGSVPDFYSDYVMG